MATTLEVPQTPDVVTPSHEYHAEAHALSGQLELPIKQPIERQALAVLQGRRSGHITDRVERYALEGIISFQTAHSRVSGNRSLKTNGWVTLSTAVVERLNVLEVITADRMVAQVSTEHPYEDGHVPHLTFLGTHFDNLRLSGFPLKFTLDLGTCGDRPSGRTPYVKSLPFLTRVKDHLTTITEAADLPKEVKVKYSERLAVVKRLMEEYQGGKIRLDKDGDGDGNLVSITCSLVKSIDIDHIPIPGLRSVGNLLLIPDFGTVALAEVELSSSQEKGNYFTVKMLDMQLGCIGNGLVTGGTAGTNGHHVP